MKEKVGQRPVHVVVMHAYTPDEAENLRKRISVEFNCTEFWVTGFSLVMGYATGTGTLGFAYYCDDWGVTYHHRASHLSQAAYYFCQLSSVMRKKVL